jgi:hypothetical protein
MGSSIKYYPARMNKFSARDLLITLLVSLVLFAIGIYSYPAFLKFMDPTVPGAIYNVTRFESPFEQARLFATVCAAVPFVCYSLWKVMPNLSQSKKISSAALIVVAMLATLLTRRYFLARELSDLTGANPGFTIKTSISTTFENLDFEYWLTVGLLAGAVLSFLFFRHKDKKWMKS